MAKLRACLPIVILGLSVFLLDFFTKYLNHLYLPLENYVTYAYPYGGIGIFKNFLGIEFSIIQVANKGAAWGMLANFQNYLLILRILLIIGMVIYLLFFNKHRSWEIPLTLVIVGAFGNVLDYFIYGHVVDMFHFVLWGYAFPVFNVADSAIFIGLTWLFLASLNQKKIKTPC